MHMPLNSWPVGRAYRGYEFLINKDRAMRVFLNPKECFVFAGALCDLLHCPIVWAGRLSRRFDPVAVAQNLDLHLTHLIILLELDASNRRIAIGFLYHIFSASRL